MTDEVKATAADDSELEVMTGITTAMKKPMTEEQRQLVVGWFAKKYGQGLLATPAVPPVPDASSTPAAGKTKSNRKRRSRGPGGAAAVPAANKPKAAPGHDKDLNLHPAGKTSFRDFVAEKQPGNNTHEHNVVALYWLTQLAEVETATADQVFTCYRNLKWKLPADLRNSLQSTSSVKGWMHTKDTDDLKITAQGINFVERELPPPTKGRK
jgi:hypothetical protein